MEGLDEKINLNLDEQTHDKSARGTSQETNVGEQIDVLDKEKSWPLDESHPRNWPKSRKWVTTIVVAFSGFLSTLASSFFVPSYPLLAEEWGLHNEKVLLLTISAYVLGLGIGPFLWAPVSELYGRRVSYLFSVAGFVVFNIACGVSQSITQLIVFRGLTGAFASSGPGLGAASVGDVFRPEERGAPVSVYSAGPIAGPIFGSILGSYIKLVGWRWTFWILLILSVFNLGAVYFFLKETYEPVLKQRYFGNHSGSKGKEVRQVFARTFSRPPRMFLNPIAFVFIFFYAYLYAIMYVAIVAIPTLFGKSKHVESKVFSYSWPDGTVGLAYIPLGVGYFLAVATAICFQDRIYASLKKRYGSGQPEYRLVLTQIGMVLFPIGLLLWGWTSEYGYNIHWIVPSIGEVIFGYGLMLSFASIQLWLVEFSKYAAAAVAAGAALRSVFAAILPLFTPQMYNTVGWGWGGSILALAGIVVLPAPTILFWKGNEWRERWKFES